MDIKSMIVGSLVTLLVFYVLKKVNQKVTIPVASPILDEVLPQN